MLATDSPRTCAASAKRRWMIDHQPHPHHRGVPAGGAERAEMRGAPPLLVEKKGCGSKRGAKVLIASAREGVAADRIGVADPDVLEILHRPRSRRRRTGGRPNICVESQCHQRQRRPRRASRKGTMSPDPSRAGFWRTRASITLWRARGCGCPGAAVEPAQLVDAGAPIELELRMEAVGDDGAHEQAAHVPAGSTEAAQHGPAPRRLVEMHGLRVEFGGKGDDLLARHQPRAVDRNWRRAGNLPSRAWA